MPLKSHQHRCTVQGVVDGPSHKNVGRCFSRAGWGPPRVTSGASARPTTGECSPACALLFAAAATAFVQAHLPSLPVWLVVPLSPPSPPSVSRGCDVYEFSAGPQEVLKPAKGVALMESVMDAVSAELESGGGKAPLVFHGFSMSGYMWGNALLSMDKDPRRFAAFRASLRAQVRRRLRGRLRGGGFRLCDFPRPKFESAIGPQEIPGLRRCFEDKGAHFPAP